MSSSCKPVPAHLSLLSLLLLSSCSAPSADRAILPQADSSPPDIRIVTPAAHATLQEEYLPIEVEYGRQNEVLNQSSFQARLNGQDITGQFDQHSRGASATIRAGRVLRLGENELVVVIADKAGTPFRSEARFVYTRAGSLMLTHVIHTEPAGLCCVGISPDGSLIVAGKGDGFVQIWRVDRSRPTNLPQFKAHRRGVTAVAFSPDGAWLATGGDEGSVRLWAVSARQPERRFILRGHWRAISSLTFSADGRMLASGGRDGTIRLWHLANNKWEEHRVLAGHRLDVSALSFSSDGNVLVSGGWDRTVRQWHLDRADGGLTLTGHKDPVAAVAVFPSSTTVLSAGSSGSLIRWDSDSQPAIGKVLQRNGDKVTRLLSFDEHARLASLYQNGRMLTWDTTDLTNIDTLMLPPGIRSAAVSSGRYVATLHDTGAIYILKKRDGTGGAPKGGR